jgi:1-acyl-sn-glycerol-3-phosphate acyltransferase
MPQDRTRRPPALPAWPALGLGDLWRWPLDSLPHPVDRALLKAAACLARRQVRDIAGWERILPDRDPFVLVANHGSRRETVYLVAALMLARGGRPIHFLADWNFRLIPGVSRLYSRSGAIDVTRKDARPRFLNRLKPRFVQPVSALEQARARLLSGCSIALFPEGAVNRDPTRLLRGRFGAARLSLETGAPVLPVGIRFLGPMPESGRAATARPMAIRIGTPLTPPRIAPGPATAADVRAWHAALMGAVAGLCGKAWSPEGPAAPRPPERRLHPTAESFAIESGDSSC